MTIEPLETLHEIMERERIAIRLTNELGPFGPEVDRVCYHLHEDLDDEGRHQDQEELQEALGEAGVNFDAWGLDAYPWEIWEKRGPTIEWVERDIPIIFGVLNSFSHGIYDISYEPKGAAWYIYSAAFRAEYDALPVSDRPSGYEPEDLTGKAAGVIFYVRLADDLYATIKRGEMSAVEAANRLDALQPAIQQRWPNEPPFSIFGPVSRYNEEYESLRQWSLKTMLSNSVGATYN